MRSSSAPSVSRRTGNIIPTALCMALWMGGGDSMPEMSRCKAYGCSKPAAAARGLCWGHYSRDKSAKGEPLYQAIQAAQAPAPTASCSTPDCGNPVVDAGGHCTPCVQGTRWPAAAAPTSLARTCSVEGCGRLLRSHNKSDVCSRCKAKPKGQKPAAAPPLELVPEPPAETPSPKAPPPPGRPPKVDAPVFDARRSAASFVLAWLEGDYRPDEVNPKWMNAESADALEARLAELFDGQNMRPPMPAPGSAARQLLDAGDVRVGNPLEASADVAGEPDTRAPACVAYTRCAAAAAGKGWKAWTCRGCDGPGTAGQRRKQSRRHHSEGPVTKQPSVQTFRNGAPWG